MVILSRTVRFSVNPGGFRGGGGGPNGFGGVPRMEGFGRHYAVTIRTVGEPQASTGYLTDIKEIDRTVRQVVLPYLEQVCESSPQDDPCVHVVRLGNLVSLTFANLRELVLHLAPTYEVGMRVDDTSKVVIRQQFDFAAAHRLHAAGLSDDENAKVFGKCNNPHFHGHNYRVEVAVRVGFDPGSLRLGGLEEAVESGIIDPFDHKNLNLQCPEFDQSRGGVNPSVEHIARVLFDAVVPQVRARDQAAEVISVQVWETEKTSAIYPG
jgi:6-pyruvoyltetrahydropterin/6-carboxytetrahydropterin synthase